MKINVQSHDDSEEDCYRETFYTVVDGKKYLLAPCVLSLNEKTVREIENNARKLFGADVEITYA